MSSTTLFDSEGHRNVLLEDYSEGEAVQANQHVIIDGKQAMVLDPGGPRVFNRVMSDVLAAVGGGGDISHVFFSHQDPDIVAAANGWLLATDARAYVSQLWQRFVPHVVPHLRDEKAMMERLVAIPDEGTILSLGSRELMFVPAHFLHSSGNFHVYDPFSKILYTGDLGASLGQDYTEVPDFDAHVKYMEGFHRRYMPTRAALQAWARLARQLDVEIIAPQHGALFRGKEMVGRFIEWCESLTCGMDVMPEYQLPQRR